VDFVHILEGFEWGELTNQGGWRRKKNNNQKDKTKRQLKYKEIILHSFERQREYQQTYEQ